MISKRGRFLLGAFLGTLMVFFFFQASLRAQTGETSGERVETSPALPEFSLKPADTFSPALVASAALGAPSPQFNPQFVPPGTIGGSGFGDTAFKTSMALGFALNLGDYFLTRACMKYQGTAEGNPAMKGLVKNPYLFAAVKIGASAVGIFVLDKIYKKNKVLGWLMSAAINSALSYVVLHNYGVLRQVKAASALR